MFHPGGISFLRGLCPVCILLQDAEIFHCLFQKFSVCRFDLCERCAERSNFFAHQVQSCLHRDRIDFAEECITERKCIQLHLAALLCISVQILVYHVVHISRCNVGENGDHSDSAEGQKRYDLVVIS